MLTEKLQNYNLILASGSPRRKDYLEALGFPFEVRVKPVAENYDPSLKAEEIPVYLSKLKASIQKDTLRPQDILLTSDTIVWHQGQAIGKPDSEATAQQILRQLSGSSHEVISAICLTSVKKQTTAYAKTIVRFAMLLDEEIEFYVSQYQPMDKAGSYGIQEWIGLIGIESIEGSYSNVVGLPTHLLYQELNKFVEN